MKESGGFSRIQSKKKKRKKHAGTRWPGLRRLRRCHVMEDVHESVRSLGLCDLARLFSCVEITVRPVVFKSVSPCVLLCVRPRAETNTPPFMISAPRRVYSRV